ncbi:MAG: tyrosine-type recombinase/integrase [Planctomycetaceae bacterium]|nr:tyrosine-type recombinase/integrase [Planctomycetaceae bacterium]
MNTKKFVVKTNNERVGEIASIFNRNGVWYINMQFRGKQIRKSLKTVNKKEARARALALEREQLKGETVQTVESKPALIADAIEALIHSCETEELRPKTISKYRQVLKDVAEYAESCNLDKLEQLDICFVDVYRQHRKQDGAKPKTIYTEVGVIRRLLLFAKTRRMINEDPLEGLKLTEPKTEPQPFWNWDEVELILKSSFKVHRPIFTFLAETGMRIGELQWLTWDDVDLRQGLIHIRPKDDWTTKTGNVRSIPISDCAREVLQAQPRHSRWVFTAGASKQYPKGDHQISERRLLESLKRTLEKLKLKGHLHTFRHSFISRAIVQGIPEAIIRSWVGHVDHKTLQHYTHIADRESQVAMQRLNRSES